MKTLRVASWAFEIVAALLAAYSLWIVGWMIREVVREVAGPRMFAGPDGMPGNLGAGLGGAIWIGTGLVAAFLAYPISLAALPEDKTAAAWRFGRVVQKAAAVGFLAPFVIFAGGLLLE